MENYKQKYEAAIKQAKQELEACGSLNCDAARQIFRLFPELEELKESNIISALKFAVTYHLSIDHGYVANIPKSQLIAWLEKQDEQKSTNKEPKFKVGDWIVRDYSDNTKDVDKVVNVTPLDDGTYGYALEDDTYFSGYHEDKYRLWTIQDAEEGDILCYEDEIFILKDVVTFSTVMYYCCYDGKHFILDSIYSLLQEEFNKIHPATTEQRHILFENMEKAGYKWIASEKRFIKLPWCKS